MRGFGANTAKVYYCLLTGNKKIKVHKNNIIVIIRIAVV